MSKIDKNRFAVKSRSSALMSGRSDHFDMDAGDIVPGIDFSQMDSAEKLSMMRQILQDKIHGISFSPYLDGQRPGNEISEDQIRQSKLRMALQSPGRVMQIFWLSETKSCCGVMFRSRH